LLPQGEVLQAKLSRSLISRGECRRRGRQHSRARQEQCSKVHQVQSSQSVGVFLGTVHSAVGCPVTLWWRSLRVPRSMITNTYNVGNVAVTATKSRTRRSLGHDYGRRSANAALDQECAPARQGPGTFPQCVGRLESRASASVRWRYALLSPRTFSTVI
jgi:hypothetical protein